MFFFMLLFYATFYATFISGCFIKSPSKTQDSNAMTLAKTMLPFAINIALFMVWNFQTGIVNGTHGDWPIRHLYLAQGFKHCCLMYRLLFAQQVDTSIAAQLKPVFYLDTFAVLVLCQMFPGSLPVISRCFVYFCGFQFFYGMFSVISMLARYLDFPLISVKRNKKTN